VADNLLLHSNLLWKHADNEDEIVHSRFWLCKGWTSTRDSTAKKEQVIIKSFRRLYEFCSSFGPPPYLGRQSVPTGVWGFQLVLILRKSGVILPLPTYMFMMSCLIRIRKIYIASNHIQSISVRTVKANDIYAKLNGLFIEKC